MILIVNIYFFFFYVLWYKCCIAADLQYLHGHQGAADHTSGVSYDNRKIIGSSFCFLWPELQNLLIRFCITRHCPLNTVHIPARGIFMSSSPTVAQHSALRCPASILQRKKSISGQWLGWLIWKKSTQTRTGHIRKGKIRMREWRSEILFSTTMSTFLKLPVWRTMNGCRMWYYSN